MSSSEAGVFSQAELEIERDYRKQVRKLYYKRESDFTSLRAYNDYLEEFESLVEQLIDKGTREAGNARLAELRASDEAARLTAQNLMKFDAKLRSTNPTWGMRDLDDLSALAADAGLLLQSRADMPANNLTLCFARAAASTG